MAKRIFALTIVTLVMYWCAESAFGIHVIEMEICTDPNAQRNPDIEDNVIVWQDNRNGDWDIYAYDLEKQAEYAICTADGNQTNPSVGFGNILYDPIIAWKDDRNGNNDIYGYVLIGPYRELAIGREIEICTDPCDQQHPDSMGTYVCWQDFRNGNWDIYGKSYENDMEPNEFVICDDSSDQINPAAGWDYVVWQDNRGGDWDIYGFDMDDQNEVAICTEDGNQANPSCSGLLGFAWQDDRNGDEDVYGLLCTDIICSGYAEVGVCTAPGTQINNALLRDAVVWQDNRNGTWDIYGYKVDGIRPGKEFIVSKGAGDQVRPVTDIIDRVVWQDSRNGNDDIYAGHYCPYGNDNCDECAMEIFDDRPYFGSTNDMSPTILGTYPDSEKITSTCGFNDFIDTWHIYRPAVGGPVTITTEDSSLDTILAVFNSCFSNDPDLQQPVELACNDDYCLENAGSKVTLDAVKGKTYYIRVSGYNEQTGDYRIVVKRGAATEPIKSDLNGDGGVDWFDFSIFAAEWLMSDTE
jgi:beta propeller repeat protein